MSITAAISNAVSGLTAVSRGTEVVSSNIANAKTPGYAARELNISSRSLYANGGGVHINGVTRAVPAAILADNRIAHANLGKSDTTYEFFRTMEASLGTANQTNSLNGLLTAFDTALAAATASPDTPVRLQDVVNSAKGLAEKLNGIAKDISSARTSADKTIANDVQRLNNSLAEVARLNRQITIAQSKGQDASALYDMRQSAVDAVSDIVPIQEVARGAGQIALFTKTGAALLDGTTPATIGFAATPIIGPEMSVANGQLGLLTLNGDSLSAGQMSLFKGGSLEANFKIRDELAPEHQSRVDAYAVDLYQRLADPVIDPTIAAGLPGLFTDRQTALDPSEQIGFSNRIQLNALVDESTGGQLWRIRDGIYAAAMGDVGESRLLNSARTALNDRNGLMTPGQTTFTLATQLMSSAAANRLAGETTSQHDKSYLNSMTSSLLSYGVDSDKEFETLLQLENAYTANAKVLQAAHDMIDTILRMT